MGAKKIKQSTSNIRPDSENEYSVKKNLNKIKSGKNVTDYVSGQDSKPKSKYSDLISNKDIIDSSTTLSTNDLVGVNDNMHLRYDKLKDDFNSEIKELKKDHTTFATEIFKNYLTKAEFWKLISTLLGILLIIVGLIYTLSYQRVLNEVDKIPSMEKLNQADINKIPFLNIKDSARK